MDDKKLLDIIQNQQHAIDSLRKVVLSHVERFTTVYKFADASGNAIKKGTENLDAVVNALGDLAQLVSKLADKVDNLEKHEQERRRFN